jgi:anti-sigma B factor antagonist
MPHGDGAHASFVIEQQNIVWGKFDGFSWIRCSGKGNFLSSPAVKECAEHCLKEGERCMIIDLEACTGMDSTFMGMLAGLAMRLTKQLGGGRLEIAGADEKNTSSLEDLGLDAFMEINPCAAVWSGKLGEVRSSLQVWCVPAVGGKERGMQVLEAHKTLSAVNQENARKFESVVQILEKELGPESR